MDTRREFLKKASLLAGGAGIWSQLPAAIQRAVQINPDPGTTFEDAEHVVFLMQENRSFDHCFGTLQGVRGFNDPRAITLPGNLPVWLQKNEQGKTYLPFRLNMKDTRATWMGGLPHSWTDQVDARNEGRYDKWLIAKKAGGDYKDMPLTLGYYNREDIPFYYALADAFTVCDQNFSSSLTGTTANRSFFWTGKIRESAGEQANVRNSDTYYNREAHWKTFPERLEELAVPWKVYQNELSIQTALRGEDESWLSNFTDNNLEWFSNYNVRFHRAHYDFMMKRVEELPAEIKKLKTRLQKLKQNEAAKLQKELDQKVRQLEKYKRETSVWSPANFEKLSEYKKSIHKKAFTTNIHDPFYHETEPFLYKENGIERELRLPKGDVLHQFRSDVNSGKLPTVSWLVAPQYFSDHPSAPWFGAWYVSEVLEILTQNPALWKKTIFILNYDENDGYFDHLPPFTAPRPNDPESGKVSAGIDTSTEYVTMQEELKRGSLKPEDARESPVGLGYRVPLIIASPWSRGGWVNSEVCDITSTLRFLERFLSKKIGKEIKETNISEWRRMITGDLTSAFRPYNGEKIELPDFVKRDPFVQDIYNAKFKEPPTDYRELTGEIKEVAGNRLSNLLPGQEKGVRNSNALPYELYVTGALNNKKDCFEIVFSAKSNSFSNRSAGAPFNVYAPGKYRVGPNFEDVKTWAYAVEAGDTIGGEWPLEKFENGNYHLCVYGPNGFFREFSGNKSDPNVDISLKYERNRNGGACTGNIIVLIDNQSDRDQKIRINDSSYNTGAREILVEKKSKGEMLLDLRNSFNWYDIQVYVAENPVFYQRYAGRVETGAPSKTDPFMGRVVAATK